MYHSDKCPACGSRNWVVLDSRETKGGRRRRKRCNDCEHRWTTYEVPQKTLRELQAQVSELQAKMDKLFAFCAMMRGKENEKNVQGN